MEASITCASHAWVDVREAVSKPWASPADIASGLHDAEYFYRQSERALRRQQSMLVRCGVATLVVSGVIYLVVHFL